MHVSKWPKRPNLVPKPKPSNNSIFTLHLVHFRLMRTSYWGFFKSRSNNERIKWTHQVNRNSDWLGGIIECCPSIIFVLIRKLLKGFYKLVCRIQPSLLGSTNSNFEEYPQNFLCFLETNFWERKSSYQVNISHYLYPNYYNPTIDTFTFKMYLLVKRHFWYMFNTKGYVLLIDTFSSKGTFDIYVQYGRCLST